MHTPHRPIPRQRHQRGFTLIEIMVVVVILGILASIIAPRIMSAPDEARKTKAHQDIRAIESALKLYRLDNYRYPTTEQGLKALVKKPDIPPVPDNWKPGGYLERLPIDPWGHVYRYRNPGKHGQVDVYTLGRDNRPGGQGVDATIGNWNLQQ